MTRSTTVNSGSCTDAHAFASRFVAQMDVRFRSMHAVGGCPGNLLLVAAPSGRTICSAASGGAGAGGARTSGIGGGCF